MIGIKLIAVVIVVLGLLVSFLGSSQPVNDFISKASEKLFSVARLEAPVSRNIRFTLEMDGYPDIHFDSQRSMNITISGKTTATLVEGRVNTTRTLVIYNYKGSGAVGKKLNLSGIFDRLEMTEITASFGKQTVKLESDFIELKVVNMALKDIRANTTGVLDVGGTVTRFSGEIEIREPAGTFIFSNNTLRIEGNAQKIMIASAGISIG